jgi:tRNA (adenine22-N1)-methyltransferase
MYGRLRAIASMVPRGSRVADIGTDHALLPRILLSEGRALHCIASDVKEGDPRLPGIEYRKGAGLRVLRPGDRVDVVTIAGMGARSIIRILRDDYKERLNLKLAVLQPQKDAPALRRWLAGRGFPIVDERLVLERRRYYFVMSAELEARTGAYRHPTLGLDELLEAGPILVRSADPLVREYWRRAMRYQERLPAGARSGLPERILEALDKLL